MPPPQQLLSSSVSFKCLNFYLKVYPVFFILIPALLPLSAPSIPNSYTYFNSTKICIEGEPWPDGNFCFALKNSTLLNESAQQELTKRQGMAVEMFCDMVRILTKIDCSQPYSVHVHHNQCGQCQDAYRDWVCSVVVESIEDTFGDVINHHSHGSPMPFRSCDSICNHVLRVCPYLSPDRVQVGPSGNASLHPSQYGGHPAFYCPTRLSPLQELSQRLEERAAAFNHQSRDHHHSSSTSSTLLPSFHHDNNNNNNNYFNKHTNNNHNNNPNNNNNNLNNGMSIQYSYTFRRGNEVNLTDELFTSNETACCWTYSRALRSERISGGHLPHEDDDYDDTFPLSLLDDPKNYVQIQCVQATITYATPPATTTQDETEDLLEEDEGGGGRIGGDDSAYYPTNAQPHHNSFDDRTLSKFIIDFDTEPGVSDVYDYVELANGATLSAGGRSAVANSDVSRSANSISESASAGGDTKSSSSVDNNNVNNDPPSSQSASEKDLSGLGHGGHEEDIEILDVETPEVVHLAGSHPAGIDVRRGGAGERPVKSPSPPSDHHHHHHDRIGSDHPPDPSSSDGVSSSGAQSGNYYLGQDWFEDAEGISSSASSGNLKNSIKSIQKRNNYKTFPASPNLLLRRSNLPTTTKSRAQLSPRSRQEHSQQQHQLPQPSPRESLLSSAGTSGETLDTVDEEDIDVQDLLYTGNILDEDDTSVKVSHHHHHHHRDSGKDEESSTVKTSPDERRGVKSSSSAHLDHTYLHQRRFLEKRPSDYMDDGEFGDGTSSVPRSERSTPSGNRDSSSELGPSWMTSLGRSTTSTPFAKSSAARLAPATFNFLGSSSLTWGGSELGAAPDGRHTDPQLSLLPPLVLITCLVYSMILIFSSCIRKLDVLLKKFSTNNFRPKLTSQVQRLIESSSPPPILSRSYKSILSFLLTNKIVPGGRRGKQSPVPSIIFFSNLPIPRLSWIPGRACHGADDDDEERRWDKIRRGKRQMTIPCHICSSILASLPSTPTTTPSSTHPLYFSSSLHRHKSDKWKAGSSAGQTLNKSNYITITGSRRSSHVGFQISPRASKNGTSSPSFPVILHKISLRHYFHHHPSILPHPAQQILYRLPTIGNHNSLSPFNVSASSTKNTLASGSLLSPSSSPHPLHCSKFRLSLLSLSRFSYHRPHSNPSPLTFLPPSTTSFYFSLIRSDFIPLLLPFRQFPIFYAPTPRNPLSSMTGLGYNMRVTNFQNKLQKSVPVQLPRILWMTNNTIIVLINIFKFNTICLMMGWRSDVLLVGLGNSLGALVNSPAANSSALSSTSQVSQPPRPLQLQRRKRREFSRQLCNLNSYYYSNKSQLLIFILPLPSSLFPLTTAPSASSSKKLIKIRYTRRVSILSIPTNHLIFFVSVLEESFDPLFLLLLTTSSFVLNSTHVTAKLAVMRLTAIPRLLLLLLLTCLSARLVAVGHLVHHRLSRPALSPEHLKNHHPSLSPSMPSWRALTLDMFCNCHPYISGSSRCYCSCWKRYYKTIPAVW